MNLYQEKFQDIQEIRDQNIAMHKVCKELDLKFRRCLDDTRAELEEKAITESKSAQLKKAVDKNEEEHHAVLFLNIADKSHYRKLIKQMEYDMQDRKDSCPKSVTDM